VHPARLPATADTAARRILRDEFAGHPRHDRNLLSSGRPRVVDAPPRDRDSRRISRVSARTIEPRFARACARVSVGLFPLAVRSRRILASRAAHVALLQSLSVGIFRRIKEVPRDAGGAGANSRNAVSRRRIIESGQTRARPPDFLGGSFIPREQAALVSPWFGVAGGPAAAGGGEDINAL